MIDADDTETTNDDAFTSDAADALGHATELQTDVTADEEDGSTPDDADAVDPDPPATTDDVA